MAQGTRQGGDEPGPVGPGPLDGASAAFEDATGQTGSARTPESDARRLASRSLCIESPGRKRSKSSSFRHVPRTSNLRDRCPLTSQPLIGWGPRLQCGECHAVRGALLPDLRAQPLVNPWPSRAEYPLRRLREPPQSPGTLPPAPQSPGTLPCTPPSLLSRLENCAGAQGRRLRERRCRPLARHSRLASCRPGTISLPAEASTSISSSSAPRTQDTFFKKIHRFGFLPLFREDRCRCGGDAATGTSLTCLLIAE
jgi:hypothetical protein